MNKLIISAILLIIFANVSLSQISNNKITTNDVALKKLVLDIDSVLKRNNIPGLGISIIKKDSLLYTGGFGRAVCEKDIFFSKETTCRAASVTKGFVALGLLKLVGEGKLKLTDKLVDVAPEIKFTNEWELTNPVLIVHLLEHTTGFDEMHSDEFVTEINDIPIATAIQKNNKSKKSRWKPGTFYSYTNVNYGIAGYLIEKITGQKFDDYLKASILEPIGMKNSDFKMTPDILHHLAQGYDQDCNSPMPLRYVFLRPAGCLNTTAEDLGKFTLFMINNGRVGNKQVIDSSLIALMKTTESTLICKEGLIEGYGKGIMVSHYNMFKLFGHGGAIDGFQSEYVFSDSYKFGLAILFNSRNKPVINEIKEMILGFLSKDLPIPEVNRNLRKLDKTLLSEYSGTYIPILLRSEIGSFTNYFSDEKLFFNMDTLYFQDKKCIAITDSLFKEPDAFGSNFAFTTYNNSLIFIKEKRGYFVKVNPVVLFIKKAAILLSCAIYLSFFLFSIIWLLVKIFRRNKMSKYWLNRFLPLLSVLVGGLLLVVLLYAVKGDANPVMAIVIVLLSYFSISIFGIAYVLKTRAKEEKRIWRIFPFLVYACNLVIIWWLYPSIYALI